MYACMYVFIYVFMFVCMFFVSNNINENINIYSKNLSIYIYKHGYSIQYLYYKRLLLWIRIVR